MERSTGTPEHGPVAPDLVQGKSDENFPTMDGKKIIKSMVFCGFSDESSDLWALKFSNNISQTGKVSQWTLKRLTIFSLRQPNFEGKKSEP